MRPSVLIPSGAQQWVTRTLAVGLEKFAYMSSLAIYVYSSSTFMPLAILAKHDKNLVALAMSPFDGNLLAAATSDCEIRVYDLDTELPACTVKYGSQNARVNQMKWFRTQPEVLLLSVGTCLVAWDFSQALAAAATATAAADGGAQPPQAAPAPSAPRSMLARIRNTLGGGSSGGGSSGGGGPTAGWVVLYDVNTQITAFDQCRPAGSGASGATAGTMVALGTADARVVLVELDPSGCAVRGASRIIVLPDVVPGSGVSLGGGGGSGGGGTWGSGSGFGPVTDVKWEALSGNGLLLVVGKAGAMGLYDTLGATTAASGGGGGPGAGDGTGTPELVTLYAKQPATAHRFAEFLPGQPGSFLLSSSRSGALQLWNVSQQQPLRLFKLGGALVQSVSLMPGAQRRSGGTAGAPHAGAAGGAGGGGGAGKKAGAAAAGGAGALALVTFGDGGVCAYDLDRQAVVWRQEGGHTETVFDCRFCTTDPNLLATASFDSSVRVWDVRTGRCVRQLSGAQGILYSVSWNSEGRLLAASNDSGVIFVYDYSRGMLVKSLHQHTKQSLKVAFHPTKPNLLASSSIDGTVYVYTTDGETVRTLKHFTAVSCLAWSPLAPDTLATTCDTGELHVWDVGRPAPQCLVRTLERHSARVFNVEFSPLLQHLLLSSSNDRTARVWDVSTGACLAVLQGHTAEVRAVAWHPEVAHMCFTGSWDAAIRVWDVRSGTCLLLRTDHHADVYGLACHPARPFLLASCSRDTTLRLWSTLPLTPHLLPQALIRPLAQLRAPAEDAMRKAPPSSSPDKSHSPPGSPRGKNSPPLPSTPTAAPPSWGAMPPPLSGSGSRELVERLAAAGSSATATLDRIIATLQFFLPPAGLDNLCDLLRTVIARGGIAAGWDSNLGTGPAAAAPSLGPSATSRRRTSLTSGGGDDGAGGGGVLQHWTVAKVAVASAANHLELAASSKHRGGASRREELLRDAAQQHLVCGNVEHCCELLAETGDWDRALALAPLAGLAFWQRLLRQRVAALAAADAQSHVSDVLPLYLASGAVPDLVQLLTASHMHDSAFNVAAVHACGGYAALGQHAHAPPAPAAPAPVAVADWPGPAPSSPSAAEWARAAAPQPQAPQALDAFGLPNGLPSVATSASLSAGGALTSQGSGGGGGGANGSGALFPAGGAPAALPPVSLRPGTLPALQRAPSLRPPPLAPIHTTSSSSGGAPQPNVHDMRSPTRSSEPPSSPSLLAPSQPAPPQPAPPSGPTPTPPSGLRSGPSSRYRTSTTNTPATNAATGATGSNAGSSLAAPGREAFDRVVSVRVSQAQSYLSQGLPLHAACCALSVDDLVGAVGLLVRGAAEDAALAVVLAAGAAAGGGAGGGGGVLQGMRSQVLLAAAQRSEASEDYLTAAELLKQVPGKSELQQLLAGRCRSRTDPPTAASVFRSLGLRDPQQYTAGNSNSTTVVSEADVWGSVRQLLLAGEQVAAAQRVVAGVRRLIDSGRRVTLTAPEWEAAWTALNSLCPGALPRVLWSEAFGQALYAGALAALEAGYAAVGLYLMRRLEEWTAETGCPPAVSLARLAAEASEALDALLQRPALAAAPHQARELLAELAAAPPGSAWVQSRLASLAVPGATSAPPSPHAPAHAQQYSALRCQPLSLSHSLPASGSDGLPVSPTGSAGPPSALGRTSSTRRLAAGGGGSGSFGGSLGARCAALDLGASSRSSVGATIAMGAALASSTGGAGVGACMDHGHVPEGEAGRGAQGRPGSAHGPGAGGVTHSDLARGMVVAAAAHVPSRPAGSSGALPTSVVSGAPIRGAALVLDDGESYVSVSEAIMLRRVMSYSPLGTGKLLRLP